MSQTPEDLPQPIYEDPSLAPPPPPPPGGHGQYAAPGYGTPAAPPPPDTAQYQVPGYVPPPPPGGHGQYAAPGYVPPAASGGGGPNSPRNRLPLIIGAVVGVVAIVGVLIAVTVGGGSDPKPPNNATTTTDGNPGPDSTDAPTTDPAVVAGIKVLMPSATADEQSCMVDRFSGKTDVAVAIGKNGGTSGESAESAALADIVTGCVTPERLAAAVLPNIQQEYQQGTGNALTQAELGCVQSSLADLSAGEFNDAFRAYYESPPTPLTTSLSYALSGCGG